MKMPAWLERAAPGDLGVFLNKNASARKAGLFLRHLCRSCSEVFPDPRSLAARDAADAQEAAEADETAYLAAVQGAAQAAEEAEARFRATPPSPGGRGSTPYEVAYSAMIAAHFAREVAARGCYPRVMSDLMRVAGRSTAPRATSRKRVARAIAKSTRNGRSGTCPFWGTLWKTPGVPMSTFSTTAGATTGTRGCFVLDLVLEKG